MVYFTTFASGSSGNCAFYADGKTRILIDAGTNAKHISAQLGVLSLKLSDLTHIVITHAHSDHISALDVLGKHTRAQIICSDNTAWHLPFDVQTFAPGQALCLGSCAVQTFKTPHDADGSCGYILGEGAARVACFTDLGCMKDDIFNALCGVPTVLLESNHDVQMVLSGRYPYFLKRRILSENGHLSNADCAKTVARLAESGLRNLILAHLSENNNTPLHAIAENSLALRQAGAERQVSLSVAPRKQCMQPLLLG